MEPITLAISAAVGKLSQEVVSDAYKALKSLLESKLGQTSNVVSAVEQLEKHPNSSVKQALLDTELAAIQHTLDSEILNAASRLINCTLSQSNETNVSIQVTFSGSASANEVNSANNLIINKKN